MIHPDRNRNPVAPLLFALALCLAPWTGAPSAAAQGDGEAPSNGNGLGGLFAESLQELLRGGNLFVPNGQSAQPVESATPGGAMYKLNFNNAPIDQVLKFLSDLTNKVVLKSDEVQGQVTVINPGEVGRERALEIIDSALMLKGYTIIETDSTLIVLPAGMAKQKGVESETGGSDAAFGSRVQTRVIELENAVPSQLRESLEDLVSENASVIADDRTRSLIVTDTAANVTRLEGIIRQLDRKASIAGMGVRVFRLRYLDANNIARNLDDFMEAVVTDPDAGGGGRRRSGLAEVIADRTTNSLIVTAPAEALDEVGEFIDQLDVPSSENLQQITIPLINGDAEEVAGNLSRLAQGLSNPVYQPVVVADTRTNTLIVSAYPEDIERFRRLVAVLDEAKSYEKLTEVFVLQNADAIILSSMLEQLIGEGGDNNRPWWSRNQDDQGEIKIIEDQRMNALIVAAKPSDMPMVRNLIEQLDRPLPISKEEPRVYPIQYARASDIAMIVNDLFTDQNQNRGFFYYGDQQDQGLTGLTGKVRVISDPTTNSIVVIAGTPRAFDVIEGLLEQLDRKAPEFGTTKVFHLKNANAGYLAVQLEQLFQEDPRRNTGGGGFWYLNRSSNTQDEQISQMIGNVRIVSETRTNSLMVTTSSQYFEPIQKLIEDLDKEISQVLIEILIVEMINVGDNQLGIDWPDSVPVSVQGNLDAPLDGISTARASVLSSARFDVVLDALASSSDTKVIARPNVFTKDNQPAFVEVINRVPTITESNITGTGIASQSFNLEEVGLKLTVTPHINDATMVTIDVNLENGQVLETFSLQLADGTRIPAFSRRTIDTSLSIHDRETAVLSGVIDTNIVETESGIPGLMHIPLLGNLFKTKGDRKTNTELLTFITPYLVSNRDDRTAIMERQNERIRKYGDFFDTMPDLEINVGREDGS